MHFFAAIKDRVAKAADSYQSPSATHQRPPEPPSSASHNYFEKKGEINEIRKFANKDPQRPHGKGVF